MEDSMDVDCEKVDAETASDSEDENSSEDERNEAELNQKKDILLKRIEDDKTDYFAYVELIQVFSALGELDELRNVREQFSREYPLSPEMWIAWIEDEKKVAISVEEKEKLIVLFERALKDYLSIDIWLEYVQFSIGLMSDGNAVESVRGILERAVDKCGLNVAKGSLLWELYREFEKIVLMSIMKSSGEGDEAEKMVRRQKQKIADLFRRQLSIPLLEMEKTYQEMRLWLDNETNATELIDIETIENSYKKALEKLSRILTFEENLLCCLSDATLPLYQTYLEFEKNPKEGGNDPTRVVCLYERALTDNPLNANLWAEYMKYVLEQNLVPEDKQAVCYRALRNCPGEVKFWTHYMMMMERSGKPKTEITDFLNKALQNAFSSSSDYKSLWLFYIYYLRRQLQSIPKDDDRWKTIVEEIREVVVMAYKNLTDCFGFEGDPNCELSLWWARFEGEVTKDLQQCRVIWTDILDTKHGKSSYYWIRYITMEWQYGDAKHMRRLCPRALATITDNPKAIAALWLEYESLNGSLDSFSNCQKICEERLKQYAEEKKTRELTDEKKKKELPKTDKKTSKEDSTSSQKKVKSNKIDSQKQPKNPSITNKEPSEKPKKVTVSSAAPRAHVPHDSSKDDRTIFVSNLDYSVTEEEVKKVLGSVGDIEEFRLVRNYNGQSKGYGYLVFTSKISVQEALKLDRTPINQRPMFISECDPDKQSRKTGLRFKISEEKNKLFVKGLPVTLDKAGVEKIFSPYGTLKDVRIVTYRNGHSKGLAYVDYEDEVSAAHALIKTDQMEVDGKVISVAISNPPERKNAGCDSVAGIVLGAGGISDKVEFGSRGRGRTQLSFIPASVLTSKKPATTAPSDPNKMDTTEVPSSPSKKVLSNADFRSMLLSKK